MILVFIGLLFYPIPSALDYTHPLRSEGKGSEVFDYLRGLEQEQASPGRIS